MEKGKQITDDGHRSRQRKYISEATKATVHPVRLKILKALKSGDRTTHELETIIGESRYNLYHHLSELRRAKLVNSRALDKKTKIYSLSSQPRPAAAILVYDNEDITSRAASFSRLASAISELEGSRLPHRENIARVEIHLYYDWD